MRSFKLLILLLSIQFISYSQTTITSMGIAGGCSGSGCSGFATFTITGGTAPYSYTFTTASITSHTLGYVAIYTLCQGTHTLIASDQNSVTATYTFSIVHSPPISAAITSTNSNCTFPCAGVINMIGAGGIPPYYYTHVYGPTAPIPVTMPMDSLCTDIYQLQIYDSNGCGRTYTVPITTNTTLSGVTASLNVVNSTCINSYDGSVSVSVSGANPGPFTYSWIPNMETTPAISGGPGSYMVTIWDAGMNCMTLIDTIYPANGYCGGLSGNIYIDNNTDCMKNGGDVNCQTAGVIANPGNRIGYTNLQGNYYINNLPYGTYTITPDNYANSVLGTCATSLVVSVTGGNPYPSGNNFPVGYTSATQPDIQVSAYSNGIVPGFNCNVNYSLCNLNNVPANGIYKAILPTGFISNMTTITPATYIISGDTVIWSYSNITNSSGCQTFIVSFTTPLSTTLGSMFTTCIIATTTIPDFDITNNNWCYDKTVTGSFDPNDKSVSPIGIGPSGNISVNDETLTYFIRFQNTGNGPAQTVAVSDSISAFLDPATFQMLGASHNYDVEITPGKVIRWEFYNIMLPDSNSNEPASHGYIHYKIKQKANNPVGSKIRNTAYIYFDFNEPVITNTTLNTIATVTGFSNLKKDLAFSVYPNPTNSILNIVDEHNQLQYTTIKITNTLGQVVVSTPFSKQLNISQLPSGIYFVTVQSKDSKTTVKVVKE